MTKRQFIFIFIIMLMLNIKNVKAEEISQIKALEELSKYATISIAVETEDAQVLGNANVKEMKNDLVIVNSNTKEELIVGKKYIITKKEYEELCKIVQEEAGNQDEIGKILIANVIFNRIEDTKFKQNNIHDVIFAPNQFSPVFNGRFEKSIPSEETKKAVLKALDGEDYSQGALYFKGAKTTKDWGSLKNLFIHGAHGFYK